MTPIDSIKKSGFDFSYQELRQLGVPIKKLVTNSQKIKPGDTFVAYAGNKVDGRSYIPQAIEAGAGSILWEQEGFNWSSAWSIPNVGIKNLQKKLGEIAHEVYGRPSNQLWVIGVTGTNGKTSCTHWIAQCFNELGKKTAVIGTLGNGFLDDLQETTNTTPDAADVHGKLAEYLAAGAQCVAMEVSSHGLDQGRVNGIAFDLAMFTNLSRDHLDYHRNMEEYAAVKATLFDWPSLSNAIINLDDSFGAKLASKLESRGSKKIGYGLRSGEVNATHCQLDSRGIKMDVKTPWGHTKLESPLLGEFNVSNLLGTLSVLLASDVDLQQATRVLTKVKSVSGRMQRIGDADTPTIVVDYAHSPDALEKVLQTLKHVLHADARLICVFGCGGDRDKGKRSEMGRIASTIADSVYITSDNPRSENPGQIIKHIAEGAKGSYQIVEEREQAIREAIKFANQKDILLIAGKGHEEYQEIMGNKFPFSDIKVAQAALYDWKKMNGVES